MPILDSVDFLKQDYAQLLMAYDTYISREGGFIPDYIPGAALPASMHSYSIACEQLPHYFSPDGAGVRSWLDGAFSYYDDQIEAEIDLLSEQKLNTLLIKLSILIQSYRWDKCPPAKEAFTLKKLHFPDGIYMPWKIVSKKLGLPLSNTYYAVIASNWTLKLKIAGDKYSNSELFETDLILLCNWLKPPFDVQLENFVLAFVEMEAKGANAISNIMSSIYAVVIEDDERLIDSLNALNTSITAMTSEFSKRIRKKNIDIEDWKNIIHVPFAWGLEYENERLEGASGMQLGAVACLNIFFNIANDSELAKATLVSRKYMLPGQRYFLTKLDSISPTVKKYVVNSRSADLVDAYNACLQKIITWRTSHKKRGELYLRSDKEKLPNIATGLSISGDNKSIVSEFSRHMDNRIIETEQSMVDSNV